MMPTDCQRPNNFIITSGCARQLCRSFEKIHSSTLPSLPPSLSASLFLFLFRLLPSSANSSVVCSIHFTSNDRFLDSKARIVEKSLDSHAALVKNFSWLSYLIIFHHSEKRILFFNIFDPEAITTCLKALHPQTVLAESGRRLSLPIDTMVTRYSNISF